MRLTAVSDDIDLLDLLRDVFKDTYRVGTISGADSMTLIAGQKPDVLVIGPTGHAASTSPTSWELVALARGHRTLRTVPIIVLCPDLALLLSRGEQLGAHTDVHAVGIPLEHDDLVGVVRSVVRSLPTETMADPALAL